MPIIIPLIRANRLNRLALLAACAGLLACPQTTRAASGGDLSLTGHDLRIAVDANWAGCAHGGYYPIRVRTTNLGPARDFTFGFAPTGPGGPTVTRSLRLEQNATLKFTLAVPMVGSESYGTFYVVHNGRRLENLSGSLSLPDVDYGNFDRPSLLIISDGVYDTREFESGVNFLASSSTSGGFGYGGGSTRTDDDAIVEPGMLPDRWIDYSGLDIVCIALAAFERLQPPVRAAILGWARTGGNLIIFDAPDDPATARKLAELAELPPATGAADAWKFPNASIRNEIPEVEVSAFSEGIEITETMSAAPAGARPANSKFVWKGGDKAFKTRNIMQGQLIVFAGNPFPGTRHEWAWLLNSIGQWQFSWTRRHGMSARLPNNEFLEFLIPGISGVPVFAFLLLITVFSVVIGPVNYYYLARRKRLHLLVLSIPLIAVITSVSLFAYSVVAHGFGTKSRVRSITFVDQRLQKSVTMSRISLYSGLAPSDGLTFPQETAVYPIWPYVGGETFEAGTVDWTRAQALRTGWIKSRTRTQFRTTTYSDQRERLQVKSQSGRMEISNGFGLTLANLLVADAAGNVFFGENIAAGANAVLKPATADQIKAFHGTLDGHRPRIPKQAGTAPYQRSATVATPYDEVPLSTSFGRSEMEEALPTFELEGKVRLDPSTYFAILAEDPGVPVGMDGATEVTGIHLLLGRY